VVAVIVLLLIGGGFLIAGFGASAPKPAQASASASQTAAVTTGRPAVVPASSVPVSLRIPAMGVSVSLSKLGLNADQKVYGPHGYRALQLVTCGGTFDNATGHYLSNVVAYTALVSTTPAQK